MAGGGVWINPLCSPLAPLDKGLLRWLLSREALRWFLTCIGYADLGSGSCAFIPALRATVTALPVQVLLVPLLFILLELPLELVYVQHAQVAVQLSPRRLPTPAWHILTISLFPSSRDRVSLHSPAYPGTHSLDYAGLDLRDLPACASQVLGLKVFSTPPGPLFPPLIAYVLKMCVSAWMPLYHLCA